MRIYWARLDGLEDVYDEKVNKLHQSRADKLQNYKMPADRIRCLGAGLLLEKGLVDYLKSEASEKADSKSLKEEDVNITLPLDSEGRYMIEYAYGPQGKPYLQAYPNIHFSLSHSGNIAVLAISDREVGIDVQENRGYIERIAKRFYHEEELKLIENLDSVSEREHLFYQIWTTKEAYIKYTGQGMRQDMRSFYVSPEWEQIMMEKNVAAFYKNISLPEEGYFCSLVFDKSLQKISKNIEIHL